MASLGKRKVPGLTIMAAAVLILAAVLGSSGQSSAGDGTKVVRGWVWDSAYRNVTDASVVVTIWDDPTKTTQRASRSDSTDVDGFYSVWFGPSDWYVGDYIEVSFTFEGKQGLNNTTAVSSLPSPIQYVNMTYLFEIPEFGSVIGFIVAGGAIGVVALVALFATQRRRVRT